MRRFLPCAAFSLCISMTIAHAGLLDSLSQAASTLRDVTSAVASIPTARPVANVATGNADSAAPANTTANADSKAAGGSDATTIDPSATDSPYLTPYGGSQMLAHGYTRYDATYYLTNDGKVLHQVEVEGKISARFYVAPKGATWLEVKRNYESALQSAGFQILYECAGTLCSRNDGGFVGGSTGNVGAWIEDLMSKATITSGRDAITLDDLCCNLAGITHVGFISAQLPGASGSVHVQILLATDDQDSYTGKGPIGTRVQQFVQIVEPATMKTKQVTASAATIANSLTATGRMALYGIQFDTNKSALQPSSSNTLAEMAKALKSDAALKVYIVGHTDNQGDLDTNLSLSKARAQAVVAALTGTYGIAADRLQAEGDADFSPVASNASDDGRSKNRRVEMVAR